LDNEVDGGILRQNPLYVDREVGGQVIYIAVHNPVLTHQALTTTSTTLEQDFLFHSECIKGISWLEKLTF
jgi:hypothetical protein